MTSDLIDRFQTGALRLFLRRAIEGPLSDAEEAQSADELVELWNQIPEDRHSELEEWIDLHKAAPLRPPVARFVVHVRDHLLRNAVSVDTGPPSELDELMQEMTPIEREYALDWRTREERSRRATGERND